MQFIREHTDVAMWNPAGSGVFALSSHLVEITYTQVTEAARGLTTTRYQAVTPSGRVLHWTDKVNQNVMTTWHSVSSAPA